MTPSPFDVPVKASEAAQLADMVFQVVENRTLQDSLRNRLVSRAAGINLTSVRPYWGSLQRDPVHQASFFLAVDAVSPAHPPIPLLLRIALASAASSGLFAKSALIGRMRPGAGSREVIVNAAPFGPRDSDAIETFVTKVDRAFLPRPQASAPAITVVSLAPERELAAAFEGFRAVQRATGVNTASIAAAPGQPAATLDAAMWSAIRAGWRDGYNLEADPVALEAPDLDDLIRERANFTRFRADLASCAAVAPPADSLELAFELLARRFPVGEELYQFEPQEITALHARFCRQLSAAEKLFDAVRRERSAAGHGRLFDFEIVLPEDADVRASFFCQHWLKSRGRPVTLIAPPLASVESAKLHAAVARHFGSTLSFDAGVLTVLSHPGQWTGGRWNCRVQGEITAARIQAVSSALRG